MLILFGKGDLEFDGLRIGRVVMPAVEAHSADMRILQLDILETDGDELRKALSAVPYFLPLSKSTSLLVVSTLLGG